MDLGISSEMRRDLHVHCLFFRFEKIFYWSQIFVDLCETSSNLDVPGRRQSCYASRVWKLWVFRIIMSLRVIKKFYSANVKPRLYSAVTHNRFSLSFYQVQCVMSQQRGRGKVVLKQKCRNWEASPWVSLWTEGVCKVGFFFFTVGSSSWIWSIYTVRHSNNLCLHWTLSSSPLSRPIW